MSVKDLKTITQILLLSVIAVTPFFKISSLYFPYVSGRVYLFRTLVMLAFFFWVWLILENQKSKIKNQNFSPIFKSILVVALLLFFLAQAFVSFFGVDPVFSFFSGLSRHDGVFQYGFWVLYFLLLISVFKKERDWQILFSVFVITAFLIAFFAWLGYSPGREIYGNFFGNPAYFSGFLLFAIGFSLLMFDPALASKSGAGRKFFNKKIINNLFLALAGFFAITLIFTQIRGALIGLAGGVFLFCFLAALFLRGEEDKSSSSATELSPRESEGGKEARLFDFAVARLSESKKLAISCAIFLGLSLASIIFIFSAKETNFVKNNFFLSRLTEITEIKEAGSVRERLLVWNIAIKAFKEKPIFGWGPENFASAVNKYYDHWVGETETWFDRAHNVPFEILATGGIFLFSFYPFWLFAVTYFIFKIGKEKKILSFLLASIFLAYFLQDLFLFDTFAASLGLFPFLAFLVFVASRQTLINADSIGINQSNQHKSASYKSALIISVAATFSLFVIYTAVFLPWKANNAVWQFFNFTEAGLYQEAKPSLEKSFGIKSPYTFWQVRKEAGWQFLRILEDRVGETMATKDLQTVKEIYDFIVPELEKFVEKNPAEPQLYYVLGRTYQAGFKKLGRQDLAKAETILKKGLNYSNLRKEYFEELSRVLLSEGKFEEGERLLRDYVERVNFYPYYPYLTLGHFYFEAEKYDLAIEQYEKAKETGYDFCQLPAEYSRYMFSAEKTGRYQEIVEMAEKYLEKWGPQADTYFNISIGYLNLGKKEKAREFFSKAVELDQKYEEYRPFFENF